MARSLGGGGGSSSGGGSRSFGGSHSGGSRSFGGFHAGSSSTRRVSSGSSYHGSSGFGGGLPPRPPRYYGRSYYGRSYRRSYVGSPIIVNNGTGGYTGPTASAGGCVKTFLWLFLIAAIIGIVFSAVRMRSGGTSSYTTSDKGYGCEKYTGAVDDSKGFWEDHASGEAWIDNSNKKYLEEGFDDFYQETGVWPYLYIVDSYGDKGSFSTYEERVYDELFGDCPGNLLFVFISNDESYYIAAGTGNGDVVNSRTIEVFTNKINRYWTDSSMNGDLAKIFGKALSTAGKQLMKEQTTQLMAKNNFKVIMIVMIIMATIIIVLLIVMHWWKKKKQAQKEEDERLEQILSQPLSTFGNAELHDLGKKYDNIQVPNQAAGGAGNAAPAANDIPSDSVLNGNTDGGAAYNGADDSVLNHNNNNNQ